MHEMTDLYEVVKQRHQEMMREAELNRLAKRLRGARKRRAGHMSLLAWELKRGAGRLRKVLKTLKKAG